MLGFRLEVQSLSRHNLLWSAVLTGGLAVGFNTLGVFQGADLALWDFWLRSPSKEARSVSVVVVEITEPEIQAFGSWPLPESTLAAAISRIEADKPRAIGLISPASLSVTSSRWTASEDSTQLPLDLAASSETRINDPATRTFSPAAPPEVPPEARSFSVSPALTPLATETQNPLLAELFRIPHLIVGFERLGGDEVSPRIPSQQLGAIDVVLDFDGKLRRNLLSIRTGERLPQATLALRLGLLYLRHESIEPHPLDSDRGWFQFGKKRIVPLSSSGGGYVRAQQRGYHIPLIYQTPLRNFPRVTLSQVLEDQVNPDIFRDRVVIIGTAAPRFSYAFETPLIDTRNDARNNNGNDADPRHTLPDLWIQAQATQQLLSIALEGRGIITTIPDGLEALGILLWAGGGTFLSASLGQGWKQRQGSQKPWPMVFGVAIGVTVTGSLVTVGLGFGLLSIGIWLPISGMLGGLYAAIFGVSLLEARRIHEQQNDLALILDTTLQHADLIEGQFLRDRDHHHVESNLRSQQLLDAMPVGVTLFNLRGELEYANDRARALLGEQVLAQPINVKDFATVCSLYDPNTEQPCADDRLPATLALKGKESYVCRLEIQTSQSSSSEANLNNSTVNNSSLYTTVDEDLITTERLMPTPSAGVTCALDASTTCIPIEGWGQPIFNLKGAIQYAIFAFQDTLSQEEAWNECLRLTTDLEAKNQALQEANCLKDEFLKRTTHELRTPLNGIIGSLQIVLDDLCDDKFEERELLDQAHQSALHLFEIVNDILDFSRIKSGHVVLNLRSVDLHACLTQSLYLQLSNLRQKKLKLIKKYHHESITVLADPIRLKQVLINTIGNAVKFTDEGNIAIYTSIETQTKPSGDVQSYAIVEVHDTGIGVDPLIQPKLFEAFVMADGSSTRRYGGSGLGLTICRNLLDLMGGTIDLTSKGQNQGTIVRLCIPIATNTVESEKPEKPEKPEEPETEHA